MHSSTSGLQCSGISNRSDWFDFETEDPGVDGVEIDEGEAEEEQSSSPAGLGGKGEADGK